MLTERGDDFKAARKRIIKSLYGRWDALACHRVGVHVVRKAFDNAPGTQQKLAIAKDVGQHKDKIAGAGRNGAALVAHCKVDLLARDEASWVTHFEKDGAKKESLKAWVQNEVVGPGSKVASKAQSQAPKR